MNQCSKTLCPVLTTPEIPQHSIMLFVCRPKILHKHCLQFLLGVKMAPRETERNFGVTNKEHYGMFWYFVEWSITWNDNGNSQNFCWTIAIKVGGVRDILCSLGDKRKLWEHESYLMQMYNDLDLDYKQSFLLDIATKTVATWSAVGSL